MPAKESGAGIQSPKEEESALPLESATAKGPPEIGRIGSDFFGDVNITETLLTKGYSALDAPSREYVQKRVLRAIENDEIFNSIISSIPVDVMNDLRSQKLSPAHSS